ncbi:type II toxin-antitoxin system VapC family toxin [Nitrosococcus oceani]|uniref:PIN domain-containing protein n=2 Tax=Nitrosococcus oceani TaxID=1229 RepID=Q3JDP9_NITOC|nr:PIN domain-containing protein [Nitrosococcus oceani]KFI20517.1 hypothetical protein IB75_02755 [Nitrosococcus oceani C-27]ABA57047.1 hypothetical protein Noc_0525 [Nitrosococcus oceani ATCC 19707]EDZ66417.1 hypothetical protein NOC27_3097 [Nitrosococcus oceani AFC27]KFI23623.1 hypothetical protein HW44_02845 [Nitrosococcus oceani]GEM19940.1 hypothetical protein NONS58_13410 [Nitrosococcus oceani]
MLLDTSGLYCLLHKAEFFHKQACEFYYSAQRRVTNNYVLDEFIALASVRRLPREKSLAFVTDLLNNPDIQVIWIDESLNNEALTLLHARKDKGYSLRDAVSFIIMRQKNIDEALTTDITLNRKVFGGFLFSVIVAKGYSLTGRCREHLTKCANLRSA